jgi:hypothetical protein
MNSPRHSSKRIPEVGFCEENQRLKDEFLVAIHEMNLLQSEQMKAVIEDDPDFSRFDLLIHMALEKRDKAKYQWIAHVESHRCVEA